MDTESLSLAEMTPILQALETINRYMGGVRATIHYLERFSTRWTPGRRIRLVDWGTGGADMPRAIVRWARKRGFQVDIVGVDNNPVVVEYARIACRDYPEITLLLRDAATETVAPEGPYDYAISSLTLHHLSDDQIISLLRFSDQIVRRGLIMNDLKRSSRAWAWIWALSRLGRAHPVVQHDGPLSVKRAFTPNELESLAKQAGLSYLRVQTHFGYRLTLAGEKP